MKFLGLVFCALVSLPALACIWDSDCVPGEKCVNGVCKFKPAGGRGPKGTPVPKAALDKMAGDYFATEHAAPAMRLLNLDPHRCEDQQQEGPSCVDMSCDFLGKFGCDEVSEIERIGRACRGNVNGGCVQASCNGMGKFGCDEVSEIERVTTACRGNHGGKCVEAACGNMGKFGCDEISEVERVNAACRNVKASCLESVCAKLGKFGCDEISEVERVANSCRGN